MNRNAAIALSKAKKIYTSSRYIQWTWEFDRLFSPGAITEKFSILLLSIKEDECQKAQKVWGLGYSTANALSYISWIFQTFFFGVQWVHII